MLKPDRSPPPKSVAGFSKDSMLYAECTQVFDMLHDEKWDDGTRRERSTVTIFVESGMVKLCLNDRDAQQTCWSSGPSLEEALAALEAMLQSGSAEWRRPSQGGKKK